MPTIHAHEHPIRQIFSDEFAYTIPTYQRPYSWGTEQAGELFDDLLAASEDFVPGSKNEVTPYFLGSVVLIKSEQSPDADVIDGQQRLTTLSLLLSALRVAFEGARRKATFTADEMDKTREILDGKIYHLTPKKKRTMVLLRLDEALSSGEASYDFEHITVEHVLPQNPDAASEWCVWWPDEEERKKRVHRLGNLALLNRRQNSAASNWDFAKKKTKYFLGRSGSSPFALTTEIVGRDQWTPEDFAERQQRFLTKLSAEWRLL